MRVAEGKIKEKILSVHVDQRLQLDNEEFRIAKEMERRK
jgi:hypothetical protein